MLGDRLRVAIPKHIQEVLLGDFGNGPRGPVRVLETTPLGFVWPQHIFHETRQAWLT